MMKKAFAYLLSALAVGLVLTSCIRDEIAECPPMRITLAVKDKNYFNENSVAAKGLIEKKADNLPSGSMSLPYIISCVTRPETPWRSMPPTR